MQRREKLVRPRPRVGRLHGGPGWELTSPVGVVTARLLVETIVESAEIVTGTPFHRLPSPIFMAMTTMAADIDVAFHVSKTWAFSSAHFSCLTASGLQHRESDGIYVMS